MPVYTVHEPPRRDGDREEDMHAHGARFVFVRDGFHFWAFLLAPLWMLRHRMWLELIAWLLLVGGIGFALRQIGVGLGASFAVAFLFAVLVGIEASSLRRWKLSRRGFASCGVVVGEELEEAERRFFDGWTREEAAPRPAPPFGGTPSSDIVGLFPQPEPRA